MRKDWMPNLTGQKKDEVSEEVLRKKRHCEKVKV